MRKKENQAIIAGLMAGVFWGTPFLVPMILKNFTSLEITFGRFMFFALVSLLNFSGILRLLTTLSLKELLKIFLLSATGFWLYTLVLFSAVKLTNGIISSLVIGCLPLTITFFSRPKLNFHLIFGMFLIISGIICLLILPLFFSDVIANTLSSVTMTGVFMLLLALAMWTWFAISNAYFMASHQEIKAMDYASLIGVISILFILPVFMYLNEFSRLLHHAELSQFIFWSAILGLGASWLANIFWAYSAKNSKPSVGGVLIVSETIFGLIYSFIFEQRWPEMNEVFAIIFLIGGVFMVISSQRENIQVA